MAAFRRVVTALAVLALVSGFAITANAQTTPAFACTASAAVPPLVRAEGLTELMGDTVLNCTNGVPVLPGATIPLANFSIFLGNTVVTSRILNTSDNSSEALLLIDEPNTASNPAAISVAPNPLAGCSGCVVGGTVYNAYRGIVSGNSVTFIGVPVNPPGTATNAVRVFRMTNIRANASTVGAGPAGTPGQVQEFVSISGPTSIPLNNPTQVIGFVQNGLTVSLRKGSDVTSSLSGSGVSLAQCADNTSKSIRAFIRFQENFATAFKLQGSTAQTIPGTIYNTESGLVVTGITGTGLVATTLGLADFGTRLRATFSNIPAGTSVYVSTKNVGGSATVAAQLVASETGGFLAVTPTDTYGSNTIAPVTLVNGTGTAVWEVTANSSLTSDPYDFAIYLRASGNAASNTPATGVQGTVAGSFAPAPPTLDAGAAGKASSSLPIPRFIDSGSPKNLVSFYVCRTNILFPFVTNMNGFDTGIAISNTSKDPWGTSAQSGTCTLNFYGDNAPAAITTAAVAGGAYYVTVASGSAPNFQGYMIAVCNFQFAHGFAFVSDVGARNLAMGYLGLIIPDVPRSSNPMADLVGGSVSGEVLGQ